MNSANMIDEARQAQHRRHASHETTRESNQVRGVESLGRIERFMFSALVAGRSLESVAQDLGMSDLLAESYRAQLMRKLDVYSIIDLLIIGELADPALDCAA